MTPENKAQFEEAVKLKEEGSFQAALTILVDMHDKGERSLVILTTLAEVYWDMGNLPEAIRQFQEAIKLRPELETLSVSLFHCFWEAGMTDEAFSEMRRFLGAGYESEEYTTLLRDINSD